ncbi:MAG: peptide chain release factor N(5)-glutamine methyltransferase [Pseudomonadota bacterium]
MTNKRWTIEELLVATTDFLRKKQIDSPRLSAEILLAHQLNMDRVKLYLNFNQPLSEREVSGYRSLIKRRLKREPLHYIIGFREFWSLEFIVGPQVMVPRPESELLVELVLSLCKVGRLPETRCSRILDLCTGSGVLCISLARELDNALFWASDISDEALNIARLNAKRHGMENRIEFRLGDLFQPFNNEKLMFDIILSNPPYIASGALETLPPEVRDYEPRGALDGGEEGIFFIKKIITEGKDYLIPGGYLFLEMDPDQTAKALRLIDENPDYERVERFKDYSQNYRVVMAQKREG